MPKRLYDILSILIDLQFKSPENIKDGLADVVCELREILYDNHNLNIEDWVSYLLDSTVNDSSLRFTLELSSIVRNYIKKEYNRAYLFHN